MPFIAHKKQLILIGAALMLGAVAILAFVGLRIGIDFTGGSLFEVSYEEAPEKTEVESVLATYDLGGISVRGSIDETGDDAFFIRTRDLSETEREEISAAVTALGTGGEVSRFTSIGPVIGQELADKALWAIGGVVLIIVLYVAFAFRGIGTPISSWVYGLTTIFVLIHDVLLPTAFMALLGYFVGAEVDVLFVMALLAVLGYSVNDTIVIFDRVRENLVENRTEQVIKRTEPGGFEYEEKTYTLTKPYAEIVGSAVSQSLARSINTSVTTLAALVALFVIGGDVTQNFALVLIIGVLAGTYSSICLASPLVVWYEEWQRKKETNKSVTDVT
jgi:preprotein translocase subunit SecF